MSKSTSNKPANNKPANNKPADKAGRIAKRGAVAKAVAALAEGEGEGEGTAKRSQWAAEKARAIAQGTSGKAAHRFAKLADVLQFAALDGEHKLSFAECNKRAALARGERGKPAASWRPALQRTRQISNGADGWRVDSDASALVYEGTAD